MNTLRFYEGMTKPLFDQYKMLKFRKEELKEEVKDEKIIKTIDFILNNMSKDHANFIRNEYLKQQEYRWWDAYYSKSTYYRLKSKSLEEFLLFVETKKD